MTKGILKEIIIILLLILAVILLLGVLLYDYVPLNKVIPETVKYVATEETKAALEEKNATDEDTVVLSYEVTATDLKNYQRVNEYKPGRKNPFGAITSETVQQNPGNSGSSGNSGNNATTNTGNSSGTSTGTSGSTSSGTSNNGGTNNGGTSTSGSSHSSGTTNGNTSGTTGGSNSSSTNYYPDRGTK